MAMTNPPPVNPGRVVAHDRRLPHGRYRCGCEGGHADGQSEDAEMTEAEFNAEAEKARGA